MTRIELTCTAFKPGEPIPKSHTGEGQDISPALRWYKVPEGTQELALIMDDPDAPTPQPWVHWVLCKIPPTVTGLPEAIATNPTLTDPPGAMQGKNSFGKIGYNGPMPPKGHGVHHYHFKLYALNQPLPATPGMSKESLLAAMQGHAIGEGEVIGTYERK